MFEVLLSYFQRSFSLTKEDIELIHSIFLPKTLKKAEFLLREGALIRATHSRKAT